MKGLIWHGVPRQLTRRMLGATIGTQGVAVFLWAITAHQLAKTDGGSGGSVFLWLGIVTAVLCLVASGSLRRPWGVTLGWVVQALCVLACVVVPMMALVVACFGGLWVVSMVQGAKIDDLREDAAAKYAAYEAQHGSLPEQGEERVQPEPSEHPRG